MRGPERGFLLLTGTLGIPERKPLTLSQLRILSSRVKQSDVQGLDRELMAEDLVALGYGEDMAKHIVMLLSDEAILDRYLQRGKKAGCVPISRVSDAYPDMLRQRLGLESPGCLWIKGNTEILSMPRISLVGSRDILPLNRDFAWEVGLQAAKQGYTLVSGNARGADKTAQTACLNNGGYVISVVADELSDKIPDEHILYISENDFNQSFSAQRAISRNRVIHALGEKTFVAQCGYQTGGTWDGTVKNLSHGWSPVFCMNDGSRASDELQQMGAVGISANELQCIEQLRPASISFLDT